MKIVKLGVSAVAFVLLAVGCETHPPPPPPPPVVVEPPPPPPGVVVYAPEYYTWDGYEWVGVSGDRYVYWHGGTWIVCDAVVLGRFHSWERYHPRWRGHAYHYRGGRYYR